VSSAERFVRHHKQQTDRAIGEAYTRLAIEPNAVAAFDELLYEIRRRAPRALYEAIVDGRSSMRCAGRK